MRLRQKNEKASLKGQSVIEYLIMVAVVIAILIAFLGTGGIFETAYNDVIKQQGEDLLNMSTRIFD